MGDVQLRVLGHVQLWVRGEQIDLGPARQRTVLAALVADEGRPVTIDTLIDRVWDESPPPGARSGLYSYVTRLRRILAGTDPQRGSPTLSRRPAGYALDAPPDEVDLYEFRWLLAAARQVRDADGRQLSLLDRAVGLWRGPAFADLTGDWITTARDILTQHRLDAVRWWAQAHLRHGDAGTVVGPLRELLAQYPLAEPLAARLIEALYRDGRAAEALDCYAVVRRRLVDELGTEPGTELRELYQTILDQDRHRPEPRVSAPAARPRPLPAQLPPDVAGFTGRGSDLDRLTELLDNAEHPGTTVVISAIGGTAGVGKTALAVHWAHQVAARFPDGQLYVDLRGFGPDEAVRGPAEAVRAFLDALGVPPERFPVGLDAQVGLYRSLLAGRRVLVVLDNARDAEQVRPLLPGSPRCLVVVTSRNQLTGLVTGQGAHPITLDLLSPDEAREMLARRIGLDRVSAEPAAVDDLIVRCDRLPLALAIVAARAATNPRIPLAAIADELRGDSGPLDAFTGDDSATDIRAVMSWSVRALDAGTAHLFRLLALHPGPDITVAAAASLAGLAPAETHRRLARLARAHLVTEHHAGRYGLHDLLRAYAREQVHAVQPSAGQRLAVRRLLDHYLQSAHAADQLLAPNREPITVDPPAAEVTTTEVPDATEALSWFTIERANLMAALERALKDGFDTHAWQLTWALNTYLDRQGHWHDWLRSHEAALSATRRLADQRYEAYAHRGLGHAHARLNRHDEAAAHFHRALELYTQLGDESGQAHMYACKTRLFSLSGRHQEAIDNMTLALKLFQSTGDLAGYAQALGNMGWLYLMVGDHAAALSSSRSALELFNQLDDRFAQAATWDNLGRAHHHLGQHQQAVDCHRSALRRLHGLGARFEEAQVHIHLGETLDAAADPDAARAAWREALEILEELDHPDADQVRARLLAPRVR